MRVGDADLHFQDIGALEAKIEIAKTKLLAVELGVLEREPRNAEAWQMVERYAAELRDLLVGLHTWIEEDEAELDRAIEEARKAIRALGT